MNRKLITTCAAVAIAAAVSACSGTPQAESGASQTPSPTRIPDHTAAAQGPTRTPLTETEESDETAYHDTAVTFTRMTLRIFGSQRSATELTTTQTQGSFELSLVRAGPFAISDAPSGPERYFRLDIKAKNIGSETLAFAPEAVVLLDDRGVRYELVSDASDRTFDFMFGMDPEVTQRGYLLFEPLPPDTAGIGLTFESGPDNSGKPCKVAYKLALTGER